MASTTNSINANSTTPLPINHGGTALATTPTDGQLLIGSTSGSDYHLATLTAGTGITVTNGSGTISLAATTGSGGWDKITSHTISSDSSVVFSGLTSTYSAYVFVFINFLASGNHNLQLTFNSKTSGYNWCNWDAGGAAGTISSNNTDSKIVLNNTAANFLIPSSGVGYSAIIYLYGAGLAQGNNVTFQASYNNSAGSGAKLSSVTGTGNNTNTAAVTSVTFAMDTGTLASGTIEVYGIIA